MAGLERGVRPIALWSIKIARLKCSVPLNAGRVKCFIAAIFFVEARAQIFVQNFVQKGRLARARHAGDSRKPAKRHLGREIVYVKCFAAFDFIATFIL